MGKLRLSYFIHMYGFSALWACAIYLMAALAKLWVNGAVILRENNLLILNVEVFFILPSALAYLGYLTFFERNRLLRRRE